MLSLPVVPFTHNEHEMVITFGVNNNNWCKQEMLSLQYEVINILIVNCINNNN